MGALRKPARFFLIGNNVAIDFANTVVDPGGDANGAICSWEDLAAFLGAGRGTPQARGVLPLAMKLRVDLRSILESLACGKTVDAVQVEWINRVLKTEAAFPRLASEKKGWRLERVRIHEDAAGLLLPVAQAAAQLVVEGASAGVRKCGNPACILYFQDKSGRRRWCSMAVCGNRAKAAAHWRRRITQA